MRMAPSRFRQVLVALRLKIVKTFQGSIRTDLHRAKTGSFRPGQRQRTSKERAKPRNSRE